MNSKNIQNTIFFENEILKPEEFEDLAQRVFSILSKTKILFLFLTGPLGIGKTFFTQKLATLLDPTFRIKSPSFSFLNSYENESYVLKHYDFYRLSNESEVFSLGLLDDWDIDSCHLEKKIWHIIEWPILNAELYPTSASFYRLDLDLLSLPHNEEARKYCFRDFSSFKNTMELQHEYTKHRNF